MQVSLQFKKKFTRQEIINKSYFRMHKRKQSVIRWKKSFL